MTVRFGAGAYFGMGVVTPYGTTGTNASIDFLIRAQEGTDALTYKRTLLDPKDLSSYDTQYDQVQAGEESVEGSVSDKMTYGAMADLLRMFNGSNPTVSAGPPYSYSFSGSSKPTKFSDPNHHQAGTTTRNWCIELYKGSIVRSTTEAVGAWTGLTFVNGPPATITRAAGVWDSTVYKRGAIVTIANGLGADLVFNGVYVVESATYTAAGTLTLRRTTDGWFSTDTVDAGATSLSPATTISATYQESTFYQGCNIKSMKLNFARNDYVQRSMDFMGTTANTGASSHAYRKPSHISNATAGGNIAITATTITIDASPGWIAAGFVIGGTVTLLDPEDAANATSFVITALSATVLTTSGLTVNADDDTVHFTGDSMTNLSRIAGGTPATQPTVWVNDYAVSNPGQGGTKFLILGGVPFICREAELTIEEPLEFRYDIGQSTSELPLPEQKRSVKINCTLETSDEKFIEILRSPSTKAFGASGGDYTGANTLQILGAAGSTTAGYSLVFSFPRLVIEGDSETRVEGIGPTTAQFELTAMSTDVNDPAYTVVVTNGDAGYRT